MAMSGKVLRLKRFINHLDGRLVIFPLDHGVTCGPCLGIGRIEDVIHMGVRAGADALVLHKGMFKFLEGFPDRLPSIFMHLSASTRLGPAINRKVLVGTVEEAVRRGADGVSVHINLGGKGEPEMIRDLGTVSAACAEWQMPLLVMIYVRGQGIPSPAADDAIAHAARVAAELGADIIKIPAPRDPEIFMEISSSLPVPVVVAGGSRSPDSCTFLKHLEQYLEAGSSGVAIGRNVFQNQRPELFLKAICDIVHHGLSAQCAWEALCAGGDPAIAGI
jgi:class I fructose-bisphosphate aldolase